MAKELPNEAKKRLLSDVKKYLHIDWDSDDTVITGYIDRGISYLDNIAGIDQDYTVDALPRQLLFDYCRYANSQALEVFATNFQAELMELHLFNQEVTTDADQDTNGV